ncbi:MAG: hypothetical protein AAF682_03495 [Planctomycetota bacterium]
MELQSGKNRADNARGQVPTPAPLAARLAAGLPLDGPVLDPACGEGNLLLAVWKAAGGDRGVGERLRGLEIDPEKARAARRRLVDEVGLTPATAARRIRVVDALDPAERWPRGAALAANPPWVSLTGRQAVRLPAGRLALYRDAYPALKGWPSLHGAFLERIARYAAAERRVARVLLPASIAAGDRYGAVRAVVAELGLRREVEELGEHAFPGVVEPALLLDLRPGAGGGSASTAPWTAAEASAEQDQVIERLDALPRLPPRSFGDPGVHTGNAARELVRRERSLWGEPLREGRDLAPYRLGPPSARLRADHRAREGQTFRIGALERYRAVPVLLRQTAARPCAALHTTPTYFRNTLLACRPPHELDAAFAVAVLNGSQAGLWHRAHFQDARQRTFPQVKVGHLRTQPFPFLARAEAPALHDEVARRVRDLAERSTPPEPQDRAAVEALVAEAFELALRRNESRPRPRREGAAGEGGSGARAT